MRLALTAQVSGPTSLRDAEVLTTKDNSLRIEFFPNNDGYLGRVRVSLPVPHDQLPQVTQGAGLLHVNPNYDLRQHQDLQEVLQYMESMFFFHFRTREIRWDDAMVEWIPETDEDENVLRLFSLNTMNKYNETTHEFDLALASRILGTRSRHSYLTGAFAYLRSGYNEHVQFRYALSYQFFFLFLEGLYGQGKHGNKELVRAFLGSNHVTNAVSSVFKQFSYEGYERHLESLVFYLGEYSCDNTVEGLTQFLVSMRGRILHYWHRSTKRNVTPLTQRHLESISYFLYAVCLDIATKLFAGEDPQ